MSPGCSRPTRPTPSTIRRLRCRDVNHATANRTPTVSTRVSCFASERATLGPRRTPAPGAGPNLDDADEAPARAVNSPSSLWSAATGRSSTQRTSDLALQLSLRIAKDGSFLTNEKLWQAYAEFHAERLRMGRGGREATEFYRANREARDQGAVVAWPGRFNHNERKTYWPCSCRIRRRRSRKPVW